MSQYYHETVNMLDIVVVNWNAGDQLANVISSIKSHHTDLVASVIVVDNASTDNSLELLDAQVNDLPFPLRIILNKENRGFAAACNQGALLAASKYLLFLNPDTRLFENSLSVPLVFMEQPENATVGICGIRMVDEEGNTSTSAARFPTLQVMAGKILGLNKLFPSLFPSHLMTSTDVPENGLVDQVIGAFFLIRKNVFECCGGFDERFFVYFEEVDLSVRAKQLGYSSYILSEVSAFHKGGGCSERVKADRLFYSLRSRIYYAKKHYSRMEFVALVMLTLLELPLRSVQGMMKVSSSDIYNTFVAYMHLFVFFRRA
jgi:GT2 family glycosyltransferase